MGLRINLRKRLPHFDLRLDLACARGQLTAIVGPSGAGKSTLIRLVAGLETPDWGHIHLGGQTFFDKAAGINMPTRKRVVGMVFQDYPLFSHLSVAGNVAFSCPDRTKVDALLHRFGIPHLAQRKPEDISGGERQRAAMCQALARDPDILLLDEPFSALDAPTRADLRRELRHQAQSLNIPVLLVTHDLHEAAELGDAIFPMTDGRYAPQWLDEAVAGLRLTTMNLSPRICA
ncbi:ATP-binding cassette domain-containing protein [Desulfomicrobium sp. ZS1]|uniref:ATP-binding cassette domain-containing protein n=1 Tax=Desulfomicrobium sp. ZS1 TaxID=2952228 RepID=UPI0020B2CBB2|nr:ATP-binding cassette domain-containing protein [Desulfomicrobium sp. ZS1]UTF51443.1 ATP-binding cassette domain-containing protein [Desulfomicrobium sp. ZS1]